MRPSPSSYGPATRGGVSHWFRNLLRSQGWRDARAAIGGLRAMARHSRTVDQTEVALSRFSAASRVARAGRLNRYHVELANRGPAARWLKLVVDIYLDDHAIHPEGHFGHFGKRLLARPRESEVIEIGFDWSQCALFEIEGVEFEADGFWRGPCRDSGLYSLRAMATGDHGEILSELEIHQRLNR